MSCPTAGIQLRSNLFTGTEGIASSITINRSGKHQRACVSHPYETGNGCVAAIHDGGDFADGQTSVTVSLQITDTPGLTGSRTETLTLTGIKPNTAPAARRQSSVPLQAYCEQATNRPDRHERQYGRGQGRHRHIIVSFSDPLQHS